MTELLTELLGQVPEPGCGTTWACLDSSRTTHLSGTGRSSTTGRPLGKKRKTKIFYQGTMLKLLEIRYF
jgi:hypothetical protein